MDSLYNSNVIITEQSLRGYKAMKIPLYMVVLSPRLHVNVCEMGGPDTLNPPWTLIPNPVLRKALIAAAAVAHRQERLARG
jgi:hypothetical protein